MNLQKTLLMSLVTSLSLSTVAIAGPNVGGGGDGGEMRVSTIRADLLRWITDGGGRDLDFPNGLTYDHYKDAMAEILQQNKVIVTFVTSEQESRTNDPEQIVAISSFEKTCRNFISTRDSQNHILCNVERFAATSESDQYRLIHHEYAGLAGVEVGSGPSSNYFLSAQITNYLAVAEVLKLSVVKNAMPIRSAKETEYYKQISSMFSMHGNYPGKCIDIDDHIPADALKENCSPTIEISPSGMTVGSGETKIDYPALAVKVKFSGTGANSWFVVRGGRLYDFWELAINLEQDKEIPKLTTPRGSIASKNGVTTMILNLFDSNSYTSALPILELHLIKGTEGFVYFTVTNGNMNVTSTGRVKVL